jgi:ribosome-associated protein
MLHLQALGESLLPLNDRQLEQLPIEDQELLSVIRECREIRSNSARKRHLQYIGKLMRHIDSTALEQALLELHSTHQQGVAEFHDLEQLREDILSAGISGVELAMTRFPEADRQQLRQFILQHQREIQRQKPPAASRKLFRYLKELHDTYGESG